MCAVIVAWKSRSTKQDLCHAPMYQISKEQQCFVVLWLIWLGIGLILVSQTTTNGIQPVNPIGQFVNFEISRD